MGIYLSEINMPKGEGSKLVLQIFPNGEVYDEHGIRLGITNWAEAVPLPTPHGRLIDADALIEDLKRQCKEVFRVDAVSPEDFWIKRNEAYRQRLYESWCEGFYEYVGSRPTIIPAEEGE